MRQTYRRRLRKTRRSLPSLKIASISTTLVRRSQQDARDAFAARRLISMYDERQRRGNGLARRSMVATVTETSNADACEETRLNKINILYQANDTYITLCGRIGCLSVLAICVLFCLKRQ